MSVGWREAPRMGAWAELSALHFRVWAPSRTRATLVLDGRAEVAMLREEGGYFYASAPRRAKGSVRYAFRFDDARALHRDPWGRVQGELTEFVPDAPFAWRDDAWRGVPLEDAVIYEVHVGAATPEGDFSALIAKLKGLRAMGVTAIELMPVAQWTGARNWGYDGVFWFAPAGVYGGARGLKRLVNAAHGVGLGVILDVVYNHLGPDGSDLAAFTPRYFSTTHATPWGRAFDFSEPAVRAMVLRNVEMWIAEFHLDGLRLDATHAMIDDSAPHILREIGEVARAAAPARTVLIIAEDGRRLPEVVTPQGYALDAQWSDDLYKSLRASFASPTGDVKALAEVLSRGWRDDNDLAWPTFVNYLQNHDQVGNRPENKRFGAYFGSDAQRAASALVLLAPSTPLLFMGEPWGALEPFHFFIDLPPALGRRVAIGRAKEHPSMGRVPDPQSSEAFTRSVLTTPARDDAPRAKMLAWYKALLSLRAKHPCLRERSRASIGVTTLGNAVLVMTRRDLAGGCVAVVVCVSGAVSCPMQALLPRGAWRALLYSDEKRFGGHALRASDALRQSGLRMQGPSALVLERAPAEGPLNPS